MSAAEVWRFDVALAALREPIRLAADRIGDGASYTDELEGLVDCRLVADALAADPSLFDELEWLEAELADRLADAAATACHYSTPEAGQVVVGLPAYYPPITEPRVEALARQRAGIRSTVDEAARIAAARRDLHQLRDAEVLFLLDPTPAAKAAITRRLHREVAGRHGFGLRIPLSPRGLFSGSQGTGKTATAIDAVAAIRQRIAVRIVEPSLAKAAEAARDYEAAMGPHSLPFIVVRGRAAEAPGRPPGEAMCRRAETAEAVARQGLSVTVTLCASCPLADGCAYLDQAATIKAMDGTGVFFGASQGLLSVSPAPAADLLIVDERLDPTNVVRVPLDVMIPGLIPYPGGDTLGAHIAAHRTLDAVRLALAGPDQLAALRAAGIGKAELRQVVRLLEPLADADPAGITGRLSDAEIAARIKQMPERPAEAALTVLRAVLREVDQPRPTFSGITLGNDGKLTVSRLQRLHGVAGAAVLALDGTGCIEHNRELFGSRMQHQVIRIERDAHVTGTRGRGYSRQSLTAVDAFGRAMPTREKGAARLRDEVDQIARQQPGPCLVVAPMAAEAALVPHLSPDAPTGHFGKVRGLNTWEGCASAVIVGQNSLSVGDIEAVARCYMAGDPAPFTSSDVPIPDDWPIQGWPYRATRMRRMRDGTLSPVEVNVHPDPRVQRVLEQVREAEAVQAADRVRPMFQHRRIVLMNSLCLDVTYDRILTHAELVAGGNRFDLAWVATGILPHGPRDLHEAHPDLFCSKKAAEQAIAAAGLSTPGSQISSYLEDGGTYFYRRKGQRGSLSRAQIDVQRHPDPRVALEAALGELVWFDAGEPKHQPAPAEAAATAPVQPAKPLLQPSVVPSWVSAWSSADENEPFWPLGVGWQAPAAASGCGP